VFGLRRFERLFADELADARLDAVQTAQDHDGTSDAGGLPTRNLLELAEDAIEVLPQVSQHVVGISGKPVVCMQGRRRAAHENRGRQDALQARSRREQPIPLRQRFGRHSASRGGSAARTDHPRWLRKLEGSSVQ